MGLESAYAASIVALEKLLNSLLPPIQDAKYFNKRIPYILLLHWFHRSSVVSFF